MAKARARKKLIREAARVAGEPSNKKTAPAGEATKLPASQAGKAASGASKMPAATAKNPSFSHDTTSPEQREPYKEAYRALYTQGRRAATPRQLRNHTSRQPNWAKQACPRLWISAHSTLRPADWHDSGNLGRWDIPYSHDPLRPRPTSTKTTRIYSLVPKTVTPSTGCAYSLA